MKKTIILNIAACTLFASCSFLDPLQNGNYTEENVGDYPKVIRGYVERAYNQMPSTYANIEYLGGDVMTDNAVNRTLSDARIFARGDASYTYTPFSSAWARDYDAILYCNMFLKDDLGLNTRMYVDVESDQILRRTLQGDAYGMRAWYLFDLLKFFGGKGTDGRLLGVPFTTEPVAGEDVDGYQAERLTYDECMEQIIRDCDSALVYLPLANRDFLRETSEVATCTGSVRYHKLDQVSVHCLKAFAYLYWASPAFNPDADMSRYEKAAQEAWWVMNHKLSLEAAPAVYEGFSPTSKILWTEPNSPEAIFASNHHVNVNIEKEYYPKSFNGNAGLGPSQELVDAFPMANGYPISHPASGYDEKNPYADRDPRLYATVFQDGSKIIRNKNNEVLFTFAVADGGRESIGSDMASPTGYYLRKFTYNGYCPTDATQDVPARSLFFYRWTHACLIFAEAANKVCGPLDERFGASARQALSYIRSRSTIDDAKGVGAGVDPYLDECCLSREAFDSLVRNEWRVETCFEGQRMLNLRRWGDLEALNRPVHGVLITTGADGGKTYAYPEVDRRNYKSLWFPIPYLEMRKSSRMIQNEGWEAWK